MEAAPRNMSEGGNSPRLKIERKDVYTSEDDIKMHRDALVTLRREAKKLEDAIHAYEQNGEDSKARQYKGELDEVNLLIAEKEQLINRLN